MIFYLFLLLMPLPVFIEVLSDPSPGVFVEKAEARNLECEVMSREVAHERFPGEVPEASPRGEYIDSNAVACERRVLELGSRSPRDEAILDTLTQTSSDLADAARRLGTGEEVTWLVDAYYPSPTITGKVRFAMQTALIDRGLRVSDRVATLSADDVLILGRASPLRALPVACERYFAEGSLGENDALLGVTLLDARETILHAGVCTRGEWRWLQ